ncbi:hypothetical protein V2A60_004823 [Cordyceps javanica]
MCQFLITAEYCGCMAEKCYQKVKELGETESTHPGHIVKVLTCFRTHLPLCQGNFRNEDPDRLLVRHGMAPDNANSKNDCKKAQFLISKDTPQRYRDLCFLCEYNCAGLKNSS